MPNLLLNLLPAAPTAPENAPATAPVDKAANGKGGKFGALLAAADAANPFRPRIGKDQTPVSDVKAGRDELQDGSAFTGLAIPGMLPFAATVRYATVATVAPAPQAADSAAPAAANGVPGFAVPVPAAADELALPAAPVDTAANPAPVIPAPGPAGPLPETNFQETGVSTVLPELPRPSDATQQAKPVATVQEIPAQAQPAAAAQTDEVVPNLTASVTLPQEATPTATPSTAPDSRPAAFVPSASGELTAVAATMKASGKIPVEADPIVQTDRPDASLASAAAGKTVARPKQTGSNAAPVETPEIVNSPEEETPVETTSAEAAVATPATTYAPYVSTPVAAHAAPKPEAGAPSTAPVILSNGSPAAPAGTRAEMATTAKDSTDTETAHVGGKTKSFVEIGETKIADTSETAVSPDVPQSEPAQKPAEPTSLYIPNLNRSDDTSRVSTGFRLVHAHLVPGESPADAVGIQIRTSLATGEGKIHIQLHPDDLGRVDIAMTVKDGIAQVSVVADSPQTLSMLTRDASSLSQALSDAGIKADPNSLQFELRGGNDQQQQGSGSGAAGTGDESGQDRRNGRGQGENARNPGSGTELASVNDNGMYRLVSTTGINIRV